MKELKRLLKPLKNKIVINNLILRLMQTLAIGILIDFIILVVSKFAHVPNKDLICLVILAVSAAVGLLLALVKFKVTDYNAAEEGDKLGGNERLITAYGILKKGGEYSPIEGLVIKDAVETAKKSRFADNYKIMFSKRLAVILCVTLAASCLTGFAPDAGVYVPTSITENAFKEMEEIKKNVNKNEQLSDSFKEQYNEIIKNLNKQIKKAKDAKEAKKLINDAQKELKKLENKAGQDKNNIKNSLSDYSSGKDISSAMDTNNSEALSEAMAELAEELEKLSDEELAELADHLSELAEEMTDEIADEELKKLLEEAAEAAKNGDISELSKALSQAALLSLTKYSAESSATNRTSVSLAKASDGTGKAATSATNNSGKSTSQNCNSQNGCSQSGKSGSGSSSNQGSGNGSGEGSGQGSGNGSGSGSGGSGSGLGGDGRGVGHTEPEKVYTMTASGLNGEEEQLQSQQTDDGEVTYSETKSDGVNGQSVPYSSVVGDYKQQALKETENGNIPYGMKEVIAEYFSGLEK